MAFQYPVRSRRQQPVFLQTALNAVRNYRGEALDRFDFVT